MSLPALASGDGHWRRPGLRLHPLVLTVYAVLAVLLTYPVITSPARLIPGSATWALDEYTFLWNTWWFKHALLDLGTNPLATNLIYYPVGVPLVLYTYDLLNCALGLPLYLASNLPLASNILQWFSLASGSYTAYLLTRYLLRRQLAAAGGSASQLGPFLAGLAYGFAASRFVYLALGHYCIVTVQTLPLFALFTVQALERKGQGRAWRKYALLAGLAFALSALAEMTFALFMGLFLVVFTLYALPRLGLRSTAVRIAAIGASAAVLYSPMLYLVVRESLPGGYGLQGWGDAARLSADLAGLFTPTALHPLSGGNWQEQLRQVAEGVARFSDVNTVFLGFALVALAAIGAVAFWRLARPWLVTGVLAVIFSLGPLLHINGRYLFDLDGLQTTFPLPFILLHYISLVNAGRTPNRFSVLILLALAPLCGLGGYWLLVRLRRWWLAAPVSALLAILLLAEGLSVPLPVTDAGVPQLYQQLAADKEDYAILTLPFGLRNSFSTVGAEDTQLQYYQSLHGKRILGGNISRAPSIAFDYYTRIEPLSNLMDVESYQAPRHNDPARDRQEAAELAALLDIRYLVVQAPIPGRVPYSDTFTAAFDYANSIFDLSEAYRDPAGKAVAYKVRQAEIPDDFTLNLGSGGGAMYIGAGWSVAEPVAGAAARWIEGRRAVLYLPVGIPGDRILTFNAAPFTFNDAPTQVVQVWVNGRHIASYSMGATWQEYSTAIPAAALRHGANVLELRLAYARRPVDAYPGGYMIGQTGVRAGSHLEVHSTKDIAYITIGKADGSRHAPGLNLAVFDAKSGTLRSTEAFGWNEGERLASFVAELARGQAVIIASQGGWPDTVNPGICETLRALGGSGCPAPGSASYALIGVKGAAPGSASEASGDDAYLSMSPDRRALSAALTWVRLQAQP